MIAGLEDPSGEASVGVAELTRVVGEITASGSGSALMLQALSAAVASLCAAVAVFLPRDWEVKRRDQNSSQWDRLPRRQDILPKRWDGRS
jgi:hypothetical protein